MGLNLPVQKIHTTRKKKNQKTQELTLQSLVNMKCEKK